MKQYQLKTAHFNNPVDEDTIRESGDFCDPEVEDILALNVGEQLVMDNGLTTIERLA